MTLGIKQLMVECHQTAKSRGWWDQYQKLREEYPVLFKDLLAEIIAAKLALITSEVSEALEEVRKAPLDTANTYYLTTSSGNKPEGFGAELADIVIRVLDLAEWLGVDLEERIEEKMAYNAKRPYKHGGKAI